jgi:hypothetical protein
LAVLGDELLVGRDHVLFRLERGFDKGLGVCDPADHLDHDVYFRVAYYLHRVAGQGEFPVVDAALFLGIDIGNRFQRYLSPSALSQDVPVLLKDFHHAGADGADADDADVQASGCHIYLLANQVEIRLF